MSCPRFQPADDFVRQGTPQRNVALRLQREFTHQAPLVVKPDNDSALLAATVQGILADWGVFAPLSPHWVPQYNGACEAGIGALKVRAHYEAARNGQPGQSSCHDVERARLMANHMVRLRAGRLETPEAVWNGRTPITFEERTRFAQTTLSCQAQLLEQRGVRSLRELLPRDLAAACRQATCRALTAHGILSTNRTRITLPINPVLRARIT